MPWMARHRKTSVAMAMRMVAILLGAAIGVVNAEPGPCSVPPGADCNQNGIDDECEIDDGLLPDCNANGVADRCDVENGLSVDCNRNQIPDECEIKRDCRPLGDHFTPGHIFAVQLHCAICDPGHHYGVDHINEISPTSGRTRLFLEMPYPYCYMLDVGVAISPDGKRLRVSRYGGSVRELDTQVQWSSVDGAVGIHLAYDRDGNFYTSRHLGNEKVFRFPADGSPPTVLAYADNNGVPLADAGPIGVGPDGEVYVADSQRLVRIAPDGVVTLFDTWASDRYPLSVLVDDQGFVFVSIAGDGMYRYAPGGASSRELFVPCTQQFCPEFAALSPDRLKIWTSGGYANRIIVAIDPQDGSREFVTNGWIDSCGGMAVVPLRYDVNDDGESDSVDLSVMVSCLDGVNVGPPSPECYAADMDSDWDVDLFDLQSFLRAHSVKH